MSLASLSIKRPVFLTCVVMLMLVIGYLSFRKLPVDLFPDINFPVVTVTTIYPGAGPREIETQVSKIIENEMSTISGLKRMSSINKEGVSVVVAEFDLSADVKYAEQQVRDRVATAKLKLPADAKESKIRKLTPSDQPVMSISLKAELSAPEVFDLADLVIKPKLEQVNQVGSVTVFGGRKREIHINLDKKKLEKYQLSASLVASRLAAAGQNIPAGKVNENDREIVFRTLGEFSSIDDIKSTVVNFMGNDVPITVADIGKVEDSLIDETGRTYHNGVSTLLISVYKQTGANTIAVDAAVKKMVEQLNNSIKDDMGHPVLTVINSSARMIQANVEDVQESIIIGIVLTILVVFLFLGSGRSTLITGLALPNSLMGAFILMVAAGFTINVMTLLALSLCVGLLIDDAIVVRENIFRHRSLGKSAVAAALDGTKEVSLAVIATTLAVVAVFGPIGFLQGVVGQFFKEFGLTICFAILISLFDALTIAPMMSAYFGGGGHGHNNQENRSWIYRHTIGLILRAFERFQQLLESIYSVVLRFTMRVPMIVILLAVGVFIWSLYLTKFIPKTFLSPQDMGEFSVSIDMPPGTNLVEMDRVAKEVDETIRRRPEVKTTLLTVGSEDKGVNLANFYVVLVPRAQRQYNTSEFKSLLRKDLTAFAFANPVVKDVDPIGGGLRPFSLNIIGEDLQQLEEVSTAIFNKLKAHPALVDAELSHKPGKPEVQFVIDKTRAEKFGVSSNIAGAELRTLVEGAIPVVFREEGREYDIRVRLQESQRNLSYDVENTYVPNINNRLVKISNVAEKIETTGPATINRQDRGRYIQIGADIDPDGPGLGAAMADIDSWLSEHGELALPRGMKYAFIGQAESFKELIQNMMIAVVLSIVFIFLVLASLYESFITPLTIMLVLPLAICGAFIGLFAMGKAIDLNSMIGCILLMGLATKNSILLVDYANQKREEGMDRAQAMIEAGLTRLRPILMTTVALIAGMLPIAIGLNEASKQRTTMGVAVIGGLITSTLLSLVVVPAAYLYIDRFRVWCRDVLGRIFISK